MRVGQRDVHRVEVQRMAHLSPVGGDHVGGGGDAGGAAELGHRLATGITVLRAAWVLGVGQHLALTLAQADRLVQ
ncbi:hypothetical protein D3C84_1186940 [compost metagenome]